MAKAVVDALNAKFGDAILASSDSYGDECVTVAPNKLVEVCTFLRDDEKMNFDFPVFLTCVDRLGIAKDDEPRFEAAIQLRSLAKKHRIRILVPLDDKKPSLPTLSGLWVGFNWLERETYDMYGIHFEGHPDLRRIYLYDEFQGYPLRKDYPKDRRHPLVRREWTDE